MRSCLEVGIRLCSNCGIVSPEAQLPALCQLFPSLSHGCPTCTSRVSLFRRLGHCANARLPRQAVFRYQLSSPVSFAVASNAAVNTQNPLLRIPAIQSSTSH